VSKTARPFVPLDSELHEASRDGSACRAISMRALVLLHCNRRDGVSAARSLSLRNIDGPPETAPQL
jgi:hypothetical protein